MQAVVKTRPGPGFDVAEVPEPEIAAGDVLLDVVAASICGSDLHLYDWSPWAASRVTPPRVLGHELCGAVVTAGSGTAAPPPGSLVAVESHLVCGRCSECERGDSHVCAATRILGVDVDGGFTTRVSVPATNLRPLDGHVAPEVVAAMEPFGNAVHACSFGSLAGATVLVLGCGFIGCAAVAIARAEGAAQVIAADRNHYRLGLAERAGADTLIPVGDDAIDGDVLAAARQPIDCALEMSGAPESLAASTRLVRPGGWISLLGLGSRPAVLDASGDIVMKGLTLHGVVGRRIPGTWEQAEAYVRGGSVDLAPLITHRFPLVEVERAVELMKSGDCGKVGLVP